MSPLSNAMIFSFMYDGIPIVYYGQEQFFRGKDDPANREPLWPSQYHENNATDLVAALNQFRNFLISTSTTAIGADAAHTPADWLHQSSQVLSHSQQDIVLARGPVISVLTGRGTAVSTYVPLAYCPNNNVHLGQQFNDSVSVLNSGYPAEQPLTEYVLSIFQWGFSDRACML